MFIGLKSIIYPSADLTIDKAFWANATGVEPYFDQPYYVGFDVNGSEIGLDPNAAKEGLSYPVTYWNVENATVTAEQLIASGATINTPLKDVGEGMMMGTFKDPNGNVFGIIERLHPSDPSNV